MSQIKLAFVANDGAAYTPETEIGKQLGYITWTPSKLRVERTDTSDLTLTYTVQLSQNSTVIDENSLPQDIQKKYIGKIVAPKVLFYELEKDEEGKDKPTKVFSETINVEIPAGENYVDIYVGGNFQAGMLYGGASPEEKDIQITASCNGESSSIKTMIRVRRNANELTKKAKKDYLEALSEINKRDEEGNAVGIYSTDFFNMHVKGAVTAGHGSSVFFPWHRLFLLDVERQLQLSVPMVSLHYWKFDENASNIFSKDFLGETLKVQDKAIITEAFADTFAVFSDDNPIKSWAMGREKLLRRRSFFSQDSHPNTDANKIDDAIIVGGQPLVLLPEDQAMLLGQNGIDKNGISSPHYLGDTNPSVLKDLVAFTNLEITPHGAAHLNHNGPVNYVPTATKDPLFFFLHSNVDRLWAKWQKLNNRWYDKETEEASYPYGENDQKKIYGEQELKFFQKINGTQWPWDGSRSLPFSLFAPGNRQYNFSKSYAFKDYGRNIPIIKDTLDGFGVIEISNNLGYGFDTVDTTNSEIEENSITNLQNIKSNLNDNLGAIQQILGSGLNKVSNNEFEEFEKQIEEFKKETFNPIKLITFITDLISSIDSKIDEFNRFAFSATFEADANELPKQIQIFKDRVREFELIFEFLHNNVKHLSENLLYIKIKSKLQSVIDKSYLFLAQQADEETLYNLEKKYLQLENNINEEISLSKDILIYCLGINDHEYLSNYKIKEFIKKNNDYFFDITDEKKVDLKITLYTFASNTTIRKEIIPLFFPNDKGITLNDYLNDLKDKSKGSDSLSNKYWALHTLLTNAGVGQ